MKTIQQTQQVLDSKVDKLKCFREHLCKRVVDRTKTQRHRLAEHEHLFVRFHVVLSWFYPHQRSWKHKSVCYGTPLSRNLSYKLRPQFKARECQKRLKHGRDS